MKTSLKEVVLATEEEGQNNKITKAILKML